MLKSALILTGGSLTKEPSKREVEVAELLKNFGIESNYTLSRETTKVGQSYSVYNASLDDSRNNECAELYTKGLLDNEITKMREELNKSFEYAIMEKNPSIFLRANQFREDNNITINIAKLEALGKKNQSRPDLSGVIKKYQTLAQNNSIAEKEAIEKISAISGIGPWQNIGENNFKFILQLPEQHENTYISGIGVYEGNNPKAYYHIILDTHEHKGLPKEIEYMPTNIRAGEGNPQYLSISAKNKEHLDKLISKMESSDQLKNLVKDLFLKADPSMLMMGSMLDDAYEVFKSNENGTTTDKFINDLSNNKKTRTPFALVKTLENFETAEEFISASILMENKKDDKKRSLAATKVLDYFSERVPVLKPYIDEQRKNHKSPEKDNPGDVIVNLMVIGGKSKRAGSHSV